MELSSMLEYENLEFYFDDPLYYSFHFLFCVLSGITLALFILALSLICINLGFSESWSVLVLCLIIAFVNFWLHGIIGSYIVDVLLNIGMLGLLLIITPNESWSLSFVKMFSGSFVLFAVVGGVILSLKGIRRAQYFRILKQLDQANLLDQEHFQEGTFEQRLIFDLNTRDAATVIYHFFRDRRSSDHRSGLYRMLEVALDADS
jgi:hypothetical protein